MSDAKDPKLKLFELCQDEVALAHARPIAVAPR